MGLPPVRPGSRRRFAALGVAAAVLVIAGTVTLLQSSGPGASTLPQQAVSPAPLPAPTATGLADPSTTAAPTPAVSSPSARLAGTEWSIGTVAQGPAGEPISAGPLDRVSVDFEAGGAVQLFSHCKSANVHWTSSAQEVTDDAITLTSKTCPPAPTSTSAAAHPLAAALGFMQTARTVGHVDGMSLVLQAGPYVLTFRLDLRLPTETSTSSKDPVAEAARLWADFLVSARPRPVVLTGSAVTRPTDPLPNGRDENAFAAGRIVLAIPAPTAPPTRDGYPIISAPEAVAQLADPGQKASEKSFVHITGAQLVEHRTSTDRGQASLPSWKLVLAESKDPIFMLAVAAAGRYPSTLADPRDAGLAFLDGVGRELTIPFVAHHLSTGACDPSYSSTFASEETGSVVVMAVPILLDPGDPRPGCTGTFWVSSSGAGPGAPATTTLHLRQPLGNRVVVDQSGAPYSIIQR